jgi:transposase
MAHSYTTRVASLRDLIERYDREVTMLEGEIHNQLRHHRGYQAIQAIDGIGPTIAAVLVAEIGDVGRFRSAQALCSAYSAEESSKICGLAAQTLPIGATGGIDPVIGQGAP